MNKTTEALLARIEKLEAANKLAEEALEDAYRRDKHAAARWVYEQALTALSEALAEPVTISCDCGDIYERNSFGGKFIQQYGCCPNCDAAKPVQEPVALGNMKHVWDAALADAIAHSGNANETVGEPVKQEPVAVISESAIGLVKLHSNGVSLPFGTQLYAAPVDAKAIREALAEQSKCACDSPAWCTKYKKCNREMLGLPKAEPVKQEPVVMDESWCLEPQPVSCSTSYERHLSCGERTND